MITVDIAFAPDSQTQLRLTLQLADDSRICRVANENQPFAQIIEF